MLGIDVSHHNKVFDWAKAKAQGVVFAFIRAIWGYTVDRQFARNWKEAKRVGIIRGVYGWPLHGWNQEELARRYVNLWKYDPPEIPYPVADFEHTKAYGNATFDELQRFMLEGERLSGLPFMVYTSQGHMHSQPNHKNQNWMLNYLLWIANYTTGPAPRMPYIYVQEGVPWTFWQYTAKGDGPKYGSGISSIDLNRFSGSAADFTELIKGGIVVPPPAIPEYVEPADVVTWLSFRSRPELYKGDRPAIASGVRARVLEKVKTDINWYRVQLSGGDKGYISAEPGFTKPA